MLNFNSAGFIKGRGADSPQCFISPSLARDRMADVMVDDWTCRQLLGTGVTLSPLQLSTYTLSETNIAAAN